MRRDASSAQHVDADGRFALAGPSLSSLFSRKYSLNATGPPPKTDARKAQDGVSSMSSPLPSVVTAQTFPPVQADIRSTSIPQSTSVLDTWPIPIVQPLTDDCTVMDHARPNLNVQRLKKRKAESEAENARLHKINRDARAKLLRMDEIIEDGLEMSGQMPELYRKLAELSDEIASTKQILG